MNTSFFGRLTKDPEAKVSQKGINYTLFSVATQVLSKGDDGKNKSVFIDVNAFGKTGELIMGYFRKGSRIVVHGEVMDIRAWTGNNDGQPHASVSITLTGLDFVDTKAESEAHGQAQGPAYSSQPPVQQGYQQAPAPQQNYQQPVKPQQGYAGQPPVPQQQAPWQPPVPQQQVLPPTQQGYQQPPVQQQNYQNAPY